MAGSIVGVTGISLGSAQYDYIKDLAATAGEKRKVGGGGQKRIDGPEG